MQVNGQEFWEFEDMDEIDQQALSRHYKIWVPYALLSKSNDLSIQLISQKSDSTMLF